MCSLSFLPDAQGFYLLMNRDEQRTRPLALPPVIHQCSQRKALYPYEVGTGTWIGVNEKGLTLALLNWYSKKTILGAGVLSRGRVIPALLAADSAEKALFLLQSLPLSSMRPFRLIIVDAADHSLREWRSDGEHLESIVFPWTRQHWFSSGYDESKAISARSESVAHAEGESDAESLPWLQRLHRSHALEKGPYSLCMHREDACTVSFTEINLISGSITMKYHAASPCEEGEILETSIDQVEFKEHIPTLAT